mmetsp:Transcript_35001/g.63064  ORF Transcript_35001/g.63064 Transcript_35001/m.63064 type:complete len:417 (-) Transcript_35001:88-1338(-)
MGQVSSWASAPSDCQEEASPFQKGYGDFGKRYSIGKPLGKGSQGRVYVCYDRDTGASRAVKILDRSNKSAWATYKREVELSQAALGRNVVDVFEEFADPQNCYIIMERFEGHLRKGFKWVARESGDEAPLGLDRVSLQNIIRQTLSAISYLHWCGMVHRDVKAHNLFTDRLDLRDPRCRVVLGDFGLARRLEHGRFLCAQVGTRKYWAPELYEKKYWHVVDVFAVGVLMYLAVCGGYPYLDEEQTRDRDVFALELVPPELDDETLEFMRKALTKDPSSRPSAQELGNCSWLAEGGGLIQQVDESFLQERGHARASKPSIPRSSTGPLPLTQGGSKAWPAPHFVQASRGDLVEELDAIEAALEFCKEDVEDSDLGSTTVQKNNQLTPCSAGTTPSAAASPLNFGMEVQASFSPAFTV